MISDTRDALNDVWTPKWPILVFMGPKIENLKSELRGKLNHQYKAKCHDESNGDSLDALKQCFDPEVGHIDKGLVGAKYREFKI